ncbi:aminoglycoside phosphotransferase family protein [Spongiibacter pelagi]|uniref:aminoglycoside phosphotransferase family protein n=1 Tax=Spongiibacter pelagi TaxID=2760804 RepID=UPI001CC2259A|nr:phosphotransferase [Spongiibacter pelagi]
MSSDNAVAALHQWGAEQIQQDPADLPELQMVSGDASFRRYYRLFPAAQAPLIAVHAPPDKEDNESFVKVQKLLFDNGLRVPALLGWEREQGFLLQEDFGGQLLLPLLESTEIAEPFYLQAMASLQAMQAIKVSAGELPAYDRARLMQEMALLPDWFIEQLLGYSLSETERKMLGEVFELLCDSALAQPQVVVHRDFHSRNIMVLEDKALGLIDFQDAVLGPYTYDLVSLLRDCYVSWSPAQVQAWALAYRAMLVDGGVPVAEPEAFLRQFDLMGLQRHIKVLGIFARLFLRDGKDGYLNDLPLVITYTLEVARAYPELAEFVAWFEEKLLPLAQQQSWYRVVSL